MLAGPEPATSSGNLLLDRLLGATLEFGASSHYERLEQAIVDASARLESEGRRPFCIPVGGASVTGVIAYADAVDELHAQLAADGSPISPDWIVVADGSGGTHAGIVAGLGDAATGVIGVDVGTRTRSRRRGCASRERSGRDERSVSTDRGGDRRPRSHRRRLRRTELGSRSKQ